MDREAAQEGLHHLDEKKEGAQLIVVVLPVPLVAVEFAVSVIVMNRGVWAFKVPGLVAEVIVTPLLVPGLKLTVIGCDAAVPEL